MITNIREFVNNIRIAALVGGVVVEILASDALKAAGEQAHKVGDAMEKGSTDLYGKALDDVAKHELHTRVADGIAADAVVKVATEFRKAGMVMSQETCVVDGVIQRTGSVIYLCAQCMEEVELDNEHCGACGSDLSVALEPKIREARRLNEAFEALKREHDAFKASL